jgi:VanZ family protein
MGVIYSASADRDSANTSSRFIAPLLRWLWPHLEGASLAAAVLAVRKLAHVTEYAVLAFLVLWAARRLAKAGPAWNWRQAGFTMCVVVLYAASDEVHQIFVPTRQGTVVDVLIDAVGGALGLGMAYCMLRFTGRSRAGRTRPTIQPTKQFS